MKITKKNKNVVLVLDGVTINTLTELRENPSTELLALKNDGKLAIWLRQHKEDDLANAVEALAMTGDEAQYLFALCQLLEIDIDIDDIRDAYEEINVSGAEQKASSKKQGESTKANTKYAHQVDISKLQMGTWKYADLPAVNAEQNDTATLSSMTHINLGFMGKPTPALNQIYYYERWYLISVNTLFYSDDLSNWKIITENLPSNPKLVESNGDIFIVGCGVVAQVLPSNIVTIPVSSHYSGNDVTYFNVFYKNGTWFFAGKYEDDKTHLILEYGKEFDDLVAYSSKQDYPNYNIIDLTLFENQLVAHYGAGGLFSMKKNIIAISEKGNNWLDFALNDSIDENNAMFTGPFIQTLKALLIAGNTDALWECIPQTKEVKKVKGELKSLNSQIFHNTIEEGIQAEHLYSFNKYGLLIYDLSYCKHKTLPDAKQVFFLSNDFQSWEVIDAPLNVQLRQNQIAYNGEYLVTVSDAMRYNESETKLSILELA